MIKKYRIAVSFLFLSLSYCTGMQRVDSQIYARYLTWEYQHPKTKCYQATLSGMKDMNLPVASANERSGDIKTERAIGVIGAMSTRHAAQTYTYEHQYLISVSGDTEKCRIAVTKYRAWQNGERLDELNVDSAERVAWKPLKRSIEDNLK